MKPSSHSGLIEGETDYGEMTRVQLLKYLEPRINQDLEQQCIAYLIIKITVSHQINITYGYTAMDEVLQICKQRLIQILRPEDELFRIGESEFAVLLRGLKNSSHAILAANRIHHELANPVTIKGELLNLGSAIGIAISPEHASTANTLMRKADIALESALTRKTAYEVYTKAPDSEHPPAIKRAHDLKTAIGQDNLELFFQPKIDLNSRQVCGVEALTRWYMADQGYIDPEQFIQVAEQSGLIGDLTRWSLTAGCRQWKHWFDNYKVSLSVAINISTSILHDPRTIASVVQILDLWDAQPYSITLEVTESMMMQKPEESLYCLRQLQELGIRLSIDDFGTGASSLAYLKELPVNELKIDKSFVMNMAQDQGDLTIVRSIIDLAHNFNLEVIAEGVEDEQTLERLTGMGCGYAQGFYMGCPMSSKDMDLWLKDSPWGLGASFHRTVPQTF